MLLNDKMEKDETDLELKKLISLQFENDSEMKTWVMNLYDEVGLQSTLKLYVFS